MSGCCDDYQCARKKPMMIYLADFSGRIYVATHYREKSPGVFVAMGRHDVTEQMKRFIQTHQDWVNEVMREGVAP